MSASIQRWHCTSFLGGGATTCLATILTGLDVNGDEMAFPVWGNTFSNWHPYLLKFCGVSTMATKLHVGNVIFAASPVRMRGTG